MAIRKIFVASLPSLGHTIILGVIHETGETPYRRAMDHFSYLIDQQHRFLLIGIFFLIITAVFALSGEAFERFGRIALRTEEPKRFWWDVVTCFLGGLFFIGLYLYQHSK